MTTAEQGTAGTEGAELLHALLGGTEPAFNPFTGVPRGESARAFRAADLGLEAPRFCPVCGRRMVAQVYPYGWKARCSRHGEVTSGELDAAREARRDPLREP